MIRMETRRVPRRVRYQQAAVTVLCGIVTGLAIVAVEPSRDGFFGIGAIGVFICVMWAFELETKFIPDEQLTPLWRRNRHRWRAFKARL
jgi:hypothetical protein